MNTNFKALKAISALSVLLVTSIVSPAYSAQLVAGSPCTKSGVVKFQKTEKFVCKKSGKILKWTKASSVKGNEQSSINPVNPPKSTSATSPVQGSRQLSLQGSIESNTHLRLELMEDIYLGHCASFLVYKWGVADTYEGVFYRQKKEYLIPVNLISADGLPQSFTFKCADYPAQSYEIIWELNSGSLTPVLRLLKNPISKIGIANTRPSDLNASMPGEINVIFPKADRIVNNLQIQPDGYFATQSSITYFVNQPLDNCTANLLDQSGLDLKTKSYGPGVNSTYSEMSLLPSGFDRLNGIGYISYLGSKEMELKLEISCLASGNFSGLYSHPAPSNPLAVILGGVCPSIYREQTFPAIKPSTEALICKPNSDGTLTWSRIPNPQTSSSSSASPKIPLSPQEQNTVNAQIRAAHNFGLKAKKIGEKLSEVLKSTSRESFSNDKISQINSLILQAQGIFLQTQNLKADKSRGELTAEINQILRLFSNLEISYEEVLTST